MKESKIVVVLMLFKAYLFGRIKSRDFVTYIPGHAKRTIEKAHVMIIELRKQKTEMIRNPWYVTNDQRQIEIVDEQIKQWEEVIRLWFGKLDPVRNKFFWSILVPIFISILASLVINYFSVKVAI